MKRRKRKLHVCTLPDALGVTPGSTVVFSPGKKYDLEEILEGMDSKQQRLLQKGSKHEIERKTYEDIEGVQLAKEYLEDEEVKINYNSDVNLKETKSDLNIITAQVFFKIKGVDEELPYFYFKTKTKYSTQTVQDLMDLNLWHPGPKKPKSYDEMSDAIDDYVDENYERILLEKGFTPKEISELEEYTEYEPEGSNFQELLASEYLQPKENIHIDHYIALLESESSRLYKLENYKKYLSVMDALDNSTIIYKQLKREYGATTYQEVHSLITNSVVRQETIYHWLTEYGLTTEDLRNSIHEGYPELFEE